MSEGNICIAEPNLEVLPLRLVFFVKSFEKWCMYGVMALYKVSMLSYQMTTNSVVNRILVCVIN